jgi:hypothetical protein
VDKHLACCGALPSVADMTVPLEDDPGKTLSRHTNDIAALYELQTKTHTEVTKIAGVQRKHGRQLGAIEGRLDTMDGRLDSHGQKLDEILGILRPAE